MTDFLLELRSEEIPARMQDKARDDLARMFAAELAKAGLVADAITTYATPRRLALIATGLPLETAAVSEETKGPKVGAPPQAMEGFLRKTGLSVDQLVERDGVHFAVVEKPGRRAADVLGEAIPAIIRAFPWPKSMRWGTASQTTESLRWVRPLHGIVALFGNEVVPFSIDSIDSGSATMGHRFHHAGPVTIGNAADYAVKLRAAHIIVDQDERAAIIRDGAAKLAKARGLTWIVDEALVTENAGLTEWPVPLLGDFDPAFLEVPPEVIRLTLATNQKYFVCSDAAGNLAPAFICTANIDAKDGGASVIAGNGKVLSARLSDARFFWEQDKKTSLADQVPKLDQIVFHEKLWTLRRKVNRVASIASERLPELLGWPEQKARAMQPDLRLAAQLAKADLVTGMVGEFPELQGVMGGYYADAEGLSVGQAIRDHYKPVGPSDELPSNDVGTLIALADKVDTIYSFFLIDQKPTGSKDPFALRRAALGIIRLIVENELRISLHQLYEAADWERLYQSDGVTYGNPTNELVAFTIDRLKAQQREAGIRHDLIDAVFALGGEDDLVRLLARVKALQAFVETVDGTNLLSAYKRAANILKQAGGDTSPGRGGGPRSGGGVSSHAAEPLHHPAVKALDGPPPRAGEVLEVEQTLLTALTAAEPLAAAAIEAEDFAAAMTALASLRAPIDAFFDGVMVNDPDTAIRAFRLGLLARFVDAVHKVADFSKIEG